MVQHSVYKRRNAHSQASMHHVLICVRSVVGEIVSLPVNEEVRHYIFVVLNAIVKERRLLDRGHTGIILERPAVCCLLVGDGCVVSSCGILAMMEHHWGKKI